MERLTAIPLKPSRITRYLHNTVLLLSLVALWLCGLSVLLKLIVTAVLSGAAIWQHFKNRQLPMNVIDFEKIELVNEQLLLSWLIVLSFRVKDSGKKFTLALWPDMADAEDLRRLRVFLGNH